MFVAESGCIAATMRSYHTTKAVTWSKGPVLQVVLWSLGDHVTSLSNSAQGTFDGKREKLSSRLTLKVSNSTYACICTNLWDRLSAPSCPHSNHVQHCSLGNNSMLDATPPQLLR